MATLTPSITAVAAFLFFFSLFYKPVEYIYMFTAIAGAIPSSAAFRDRARRGVIDMAARGALSVPVARTFPLSEARTAMELLRGQHPGGKFALIP